MKYLRIRELSIYIVADAGGGAAAARLPVQLEHVSTVARLGVGPGSGPLFQVQLRISYLYKLNQTYNISTVLFPFIPRKFLAKLIFKIFLFRNFR